MSDMSDFSDKFDPGPSPVQVEVSKSGGMLPGGLKAICIIAIILGSLGVLAALTTGVSLVAGPALQKAMNPGQQGGPPEMQKMQQVQQEMQAELSALAQKLIIPNAAAVMVHLITAILLVIGAIMVLQRKRAGLGVLTMGCVSSIFYLICQRVLDIVFTVKAMPVYERFGEGMMQEAARGGQGPDMSKFMLVFVIIGIAFSILWALAMIIFYSVAIVHLRRPKVTALFGAGGPVTMSI